MWHKIRCDRESNFFLQNFLGTKALFSSKIFGKITTVAI